MHNCVHAMSIYVRHRWSVSEVKFNSPPFRVEKGTLSMKNANTNSNSAMGKTSKKENKVFLGVPTGNLEISNALKGIAKEKVSLEIPALKLLISPAGTDKRNAPLFTIFDGELQSFVGSTKGGGAATYKVAETRSRILDRAKNTLRGSVVFTTVSNWLAEYQPTEKEAGKWISPKFEFKVVDLNKIFSTFSGVVDFIDEIEKAARSNDFACPSMEGHGDEPTGLISSLKRKGNFVSFVFNFRPVSKSVRASVHRNADKTYAELQALNVLKLITK